MRKGAIPVPYIIALILGIIVIALVTYWFFVTGGKFGCTLGKSECEAKRLQFCSEWRAASPDFSKDPPKTWDEYTDGGCSSITCGVKAAKGDCEALFK